MTEALDFEVLCSQLGDRLLPEADQLVNLGVAVGQAAAEVRNLLFEPRDLRFAWVWDGAGFLEEITASAEFLG